jgi:predicted metal-binding membrane protein
MSKSTRKAIAERRARARRRKRINYSIAAILVLAWGAVIFFVIQNRAEGASQYAGIDPNKSKGDPDAPILVVEYGDFQ